MLVFCLLCTAACGVEQGTLEIDGPPMPLAVDSDVRLSLLAPTGHRCWSLFGGCGGGPRVEVTSVHVDPPGVVEVLSTEGGGVALHALDVGVVEIDVRATLDGDSKAAFATLVVEEAVGVEPAQQTPRRFAVQGSATVPVRVWSSASAEVWASGVEALEVGDMPVGLVGEGVELSVREGEEVEVRSLFSGESFFTAVGVDGSVRDWSPSIEVRPGSVRAVPTMDGLPLFGAALPECEYTIAGQERDGVPTRYATHDCPVATTLTPNVCRFDALDCNVPGACVAGVDADDGTQSLMQWDAATPIVVERPGVCALSFSTRAGVVEHSFSVS